MTSDNEEQSSRDDIVIWARSIFPKFFQSFQTRFSALFPPSHILPSIVTSSSTNIPQPIPIDDEYEC